MVLEEKIRGFEQPPAKRVFLEARHRDSEISFRILLKPFAVVPAEMAGFEDVRTVLDSALGAPQLFLEPRKLRAAEQTERMPASLVHQSFRALGS